jgi:hypothetical protein
VIVHNPDRLQRLAALYAVRLGLDVRRVIVFAFVHAGLAAPAYRLSAEVFAPLVDDGWDR